MGNPRSQGPEGGFLPTWSARRHRIRLAKLYLDRIGYLRYLLSSRRCRRLDRSFPCSEGSRRSATPGGGYAACDGVPQ